jgi:hypothetical protein
MGLHFSHGNAHWSYMGFMRFRTKLAAEIGVALRCMENFAFTIYGEPCNELRLYKHEGTHPPTKLVGIQPVIKWSTVHDDIVPLLNHSDCDGILTPEECRRVAPRLRELVSRWPDDDYDKIQALLLADGMDAAAEANEPLEFC